MGVGRIALFGDQINRPYWDRGKWSVKFSRHGGSSWCRKAYTRKGGEGVAYTDFFLYDLNTELVVLLGCR
jgi:hypothetical protein